MNVSHTTLSEKRVFKIMDASKELFL